MVPLTDFFVAENEILGVRKGPSWGLNPHAEVTAVRIIPDHGSSQGKSTSAVCALSSPQLLVLPQIFNTDGFHPVVLGILKINASNRRKLLELLGKHQDLLTGEHNVPDQGSFLLHESLDRGDLIFQPLATKCA